MQKLEKNQSRMTGAKTTPSLLVPNRWNTYSSTNTAQEMPITASAGSTRGLSGAETHQRQQLQAKSSCITPSKLVACNMSYMRKEAQLDLAH